MELDKRLKFYRLSRSEYERIESLLGRPPQGVEWALFSALWSEHCSYKSSRVHLKKFAFKSARVRVVESVGENAGIIDLGEGERVAFKMESHNHPSFIEPTQGAATGVGGILRDIFTMGARPVASADYLCFGEPTADRMEALVAGVVKGIGGYGNCVGVPTITGQTEFHASYNTNILVNAMNVGVFQPEDKVFLSKASGPGNYVVYVGAKTGRDGVHGASMASESFDEDSEKKRPNVQIGDPFFEKLLIESCLEAMSENLVVAIQDMGAAGLTSSSFEMASKGNVGFEIHLDRVPLRDPSMSPEEVLLSESQERMLLICEPEKFDRLKSIFDRWDLDATVIGNVVSERKVTLHWRGETLTSLDPHLLVEEAPLYERPFKIWTSQNRVSKREEIFSTLQKALGSKSGSEVLKTILRDFRGASRSWIYRQYDQRVGASTVLDADHSIGALRLKSSGRGLGMVLGCRPYLMRWDARVGAMDAIVHPALELAVKGFEPLAVTDCLNFGNPERESIMSEFVASVEAMSEICKALGTPVISGNVSFYNETLGKNISSTPATGVVGLRRSGVNQIPSDLFESEDDKIFLIRLPQVTLGGALNENLCGSSLGVGELDATQLASFVNRTLEIANRFPIRSSRVVGKFGLAYTLARMGRKRGCRILEEDLGRVGITQKEMLFCENLYEAILVLPEKASGNFLRDLSTHVEAHYLGSVGGDDLQIGEWISLSTQEIQKSYQQGWGETFEALA